MKEKLYLIAKIGIAACFIAFLSPAIFKEKDSPAAFADVLVQTTSNIDMTDYPEQDFQAMRRYLALDPSIYEDIRFYRTDDAMSADELVIVKFANDSQAEEFEQLIQSRIDSQTSIYEGYAPEQTAIMQNAKLVVHANYAIYVAGEQADVILSQFEGAL